MSNGRPRPPSRDAVLEAKAKLEAGDKLDAQRSLLRSILRGRRRPGRRR